MKMGACQKRAFTLFELLVVIGIIALLATMGVGALRGFTAVNVVKAGNRQLLDDINMARNYAQRERTTVYMVFVPPVLDQLKKPIKQEELKFWTNRIAGQLASYNFVTLHSPGDQPGRGRPRYLGEWKHLPEGVFLAPDELFPMPTAQWMAKSLTADGTNLPLPGFVVPFPTSKSLETNALPCIAFNYRGALLGPDGDRPRNVDEYIRLTRGSMVLDRASDGRLTFKPPEIIETPKGNTTNNPYIRIDWITGRARIEEPKT